MWASRSAFHVLCIDSLRSGGPIEPTAVAWLTGASIFDRATRGRGERPVTGDGDETNLGEPINYNTPISLTKAVAE